MATVGIQPTFLKESRPISCQKTSAFLPEEMPAWLKSRGEYLCFLDDDSWFLDDDFLITAVCRFKKYPRMGLLQPRITDPEHSDQNPTRWIPRLKKRTAEEPSRVFHVGETCLVTTRELFDLTGGWAGGFWYAHEGIELAWRIWDTGTYVWYAGDMRIGHPVVDPRRHEEFYRLNARNRVWLARRNLPAPFTWIYPTTWMLIECLRMRKKPNAVNQYLAGWKAGWKGSPWYREPRSKPRWITAASNDAFWTTTYYLASNFEFARENQARILRSAVEACPIAMGSNDIVDLSFKLKMNKR
ncbi:glycosyltransferase family 2 protein [Glutamicibacter halophytocola]|uniref:glycosyltransferase family 2 protein n=1 Tax=Glutamicibacter halophytocola TaxID=1933880 RepID=UPI003219CA8E